MSKLQSVKGVMKTLFWMTKEDWVEMDKKFYRIVFGVISFILMAFFYLYFLRSIIHF
ncbi:MAG: hypothetical protein NT120_04945 [Candidatus Aenigmarchaeota archaeon]|nr:hypothetical protein [Candidatus Aenigmarchaeota archaeon]